MAPYVADSSQPTRASALRQTPAPNRIVPAIPFALSRKPQLKKPAIQDEPLPVTEVAQPNVENQNTVTSSEAPLEAAESIAVTSASLDDEDRQSPFTGGEDVTHPVEENGKPTLEGLEPPEVADGALTPRADTAIARDVSLEQIQSAQAVATEKRDAELEVGPVAGKWRYHALTGFKLTLVEESIISNASMSPSKESSFSPPQNLPPPFYPSSHRATPSSVTSSSVSQPPSSVVNVPLHNVHPSVNGIIFGEYADSSSSSPVPPSLSTAPPNPYPPSMQAVPNHLLGNSYHLTQGHTFGHTPHFSDPRVPIMYSMPFNPAAYGPGGDGSNHHAHSDRPHGWVFPIGQAHHPVPTVEQKPLDYPPQHANGDLPESSAAAGAAQETSLQDAHSDSAIISLRSSHTSLTESHSEVDDDSIDSLTKYLASQFGNRHFADYIIQLFHLYNLFPPAPIPAHRLIIARSPTLLALMSSNDSDPRLSPKLLKVSVTDDFTNIFAFTEALKYLYGLPLLSTSGLLSNLPPLRFDSTGYGERTGSGTAMDRMGYVLAYAASGFLLQLNQIVTRGVEIAEKLLRWDTLGLALAFALDGGLDVSWIPEGSRQQHDNKWMNDMSVQPEQFSAPRFGTYATRLLRNIVSFLVLNFPKEFEFDSGASQIRNVPRLPVVVESWASSSNPRLSHIRFGEVPIEETPKPNPVHTLLSSIFLSVPFPVLQCIFESSDLEERVGSERFMHIKLKVIEERESRRRKAIEGRTVPSYNRALDEALWRNTLWAEKLERVREDSSGLRLVRERQEPHTPNSAVSGIS